MLINRHLDFCVLLFNFKVCKSIIFVCVLWYEKAPDHQQRIFTTLALIKGINSPHLFMKSCAFDTLIWPVKTSLCIYNCFRANLHLLKKNSNLENLHTPKHQRGLNLYLPSHQTLNDTMLRYTWCHLVVMGSLGHIQFRTLFIADKSLPREE